MSDEVETELIQPMECKVCVFYQPGKINEGNGICHRIPLHPLFNDKTQTVMHVHTLVPEDYWCGEFRECIIESETPH